MTRYHVGDYVVITSSFRSIIGAGSIATDGTKAVVLNIGDTPTGQMVALDINGVVEWFPDTDLEKV